MENANNITANNQIQTATHQKICNGSIYARPYNPDATGFYFDDPEEFQDKAEALRDAHGNKVEEFELMYIDGDDGALFEACGINQANLKTWFDDIDPLQDQEKIALYYLVNGVGYVLADALEKVEDVYLYTGRLQDAAQEYFEDNFVESVPENLRTYFDYKAFANDCQQGGDMVEFEYKNKIYTVTNANGI
jgi:Antirestriction protein (ArdA)